MIRNRDEASVDSTPMLSARTTQPKGRARSQQPSSAFRAAGQLHGRCRQSSEQLLRTFSTP